MADSDLKTILIRLAQIEKANHAPVWEWIMKAMIPVVGALVVWGVSVETRMARMDAEVQNAPGRGWLKEDVQEIKATQKEILARLRSLEKGR